MPKFNITTFLRTLILLWVITQPMYFWHWLTQVKELYIPLNSMVFHAVLGLCAMLLLFKASHKPRFLIGIVFISFTAAILHWCIFTNFFPQALFIKAVTLVYLF